MAQHHKLVCGSLFVFFAATHVGCAGSGLKNIFTRNETDGYHSLDELQTEEQPVAATEESEEDAEKPSIATRLASWRPFGKSDPTEEETYAASDAAASDADSEDAGTSSRFLGRGIPKRDSVEPDPFLIDEQKPADRAESAALNTKSDKKIAKTDDKSKAADDEFVIAADPQPKSEKSTSAGIRKSKDQKDQTESTDSDTDAVALEASRKAVATESNNEDDDNALAKRFEQHFLLNSVGAVAKIENDAVATGKDLRQKAATKAEAKQREVSDIADRQISEFDYLLTADPDLEGEKSRFRRNADVSPLKNSKLNTAMVEKSGDSLSAFDQLLGTEGSVAGQAESEATHTATRSPKKKASALDINVADAEALFGAAAARKTTQLQHPAFAHRTESSDRPADSRNAWSQASENPDGFETEAPRHVKPGSLSNRTHGDVANAFARSLAGNSRNSKVPMHNAAFGVPAASAGDVEGDDELAGENADIRLSNASVFSGDRRIVTADYGSVQPGGIIHAATNETSASDDPQFTAAPVAPVSEQDSDSEAASAAARPGLVQSFSTRNWLLLIGGIIVIALLFAPSRTKPLSVNGRPANG